MNKTYYTKTYYTRIKNDDPTIGGGNKYVQGVIMGIMLSVCRECVEDSFLTFIAKFMFRIFHY